MLIIVCGLPGSGKSSLSIELSKLFSAVHLNSDVIRKTLFPKPEYTKEEKERVYLEMAREAQNLLNSGKNVVLDATFFQKRFRDMMRELVEKCGGEIYIIWCVLGEHKIKGRLLQRKSTVSDADYKVYIKLKEEFEPVQGEHLKIDSSLPMEEMVRKAKEFIEGD